MLTGCRRIEVLGLRWDDLNFDIGEMRLPDTKTGKLLAHAKVQTTVRYARLGRQSVKVAAVRISDSLEADMATPPDVPAVPWSLRRGASGFRQPAAFSHDHPPLGPIPGGYRKGLMSRFL